MRNYPADSWRRLGIWVHDQRVKKSETRKMPEWASTVGRSTRMLQGLERGEPVGAGTLEKVADALGVDVAVLYSELEGPSAPIGDFPVSPPQHRRTDQRASSFEEWVEQLADRVEDLELRVGQLEGHDDDSGPATNQAGASPAADIEEQRRRRRGVSDPAPTVPEEQAVAMDDPDLLSEREAQIEDP